MSKTQTSEYVQNGVKYKPGGYYLLVEIEAVHCKKSLIVRPDEDEIKEKYLKSRRYGIVRAMGSMCYNDESSPRCTVGDRIGFNTYTGIDANRSIEGEVPENEPLLRYMLDKEVLGTVEIIREKE
jgi:co-chaperonin GroES (HSP10)